MKIKIKKARKDNFPAVFKLILELAKFEKLKPPGESERKRLLKDAFGPKPFYHILIALNGEYVIGYAFYFFTYSSFLGKRTLYLEDIYVTKKYRNSGIGKLFMEKLISIAKKKKCGRMEWCVLNWNKNAINFYEKLGAKPLKKWTYYRLEL